MYAIIRSGGKQFKVKPGERVRVDSMKADVGADVAILDVLALHDGEHLSLGKPLVESATVQAKVLSHGRGKKIIVFKKKRRSGYHLKQGHRQDYTEILIESFALNGETLEVPAAPIEEEAPRPAKAKKTAAKAKKSAVKAAAPVEEETPESVEEEQVEVEPQDDEDEAKPTE